MQPISKKMEVQFRGPTNSEEFNEWADNLHYDLMQLFSTEEQHQISIGANLEMLVTENIMLQKKIRELEALFSDVSKTIENLGTTQDKVLTHLFTTEENLNPITTVRLDAEHNVFMAPVAQETSKLYLHNVNGENLIPSQLKCRLYESTSPFLIDETEVQAEIVAETEDLRRIVDGDSTSFFLHKTTYDTSVNAVYFCLELELPMNIVSHQRANALKLTPTPLGAMSLLGIVYQSQQDWAALPTYPQTEVGGEIVPDEITELGQEIFCFPARDVKGIRIYGKQTNWFNENGERIFYYGFRSLEIDYISFAAQNLDETGLEKGARARVKFTIPDPVCQFLTVSRVTPLFANGSVKPATPEDEAEFFVVNYIYVDEREYAIGETLPLETKEVEIDFSLRLINETSPLLAGLKIEYQST